MSGTKRGELVPNVGDLGAALLPHAKRSKTDRDASAAVAVDPHAAAAGAAFFDEEVDKVEALLKSGTKIELEEAKNDIEAVLAAGGTRIPPAHAAAHGCLHDVVRPPGWTPDPNARVYDEKNPAKVYPFRLDTFQQKSVEVMEQGESVMVAAHTSAGKTVVAEYAIAMALRDGQRVVYTSPLKALSNQKFRELKDEFGDVGLMTGDTVINESASCLVMTTEVLRSMLYRGGEVMREVGWVIFDEIHYMRDFERGVVWEETVHFLPDAVRYVFLSATIPNAKEFAEWIVKTHGHPCHLVYTDYRPTPLEHYIFPKGGDGIYLSFDRDNKFRQDNFLKAINAIAPASDGYAANKTANRTETGGGGSGDGKGKGEEMKHLEVYKIVKMIADKNYDPCIVFTFDKKMIEEQAKALDRLDLNSDTEKSMIDAIFEASIAQLSPEDQNLPQVVKILPMVKRGIGFHHSGLLPVLKEVIEILFQEGLIKVLIATETMSTGLNMPCRSVVFTAPRKYDGAEFGYRWISSGEYVQMSGRAGRRGLDDRGLVVLMMDERMDPQIAKGMLHGRSDPLNSAFRLHYPMLLNLMRMEGGEECERLIKRSFKQFQTDRDIPKLELKCAQLAAARDAVAVPDEAKVEEYVNLRDTLSVLRGERRGWLNHPDNALQFLQVGRCVKVCARDPRQIAEEAARAGEDGGVAQLAASSVTAEWGVVVKHERDGAEYLVDVVLNIEEQPHDARRPRKGNLGRFRVRPMNWDGKAPLEGEEDEWTGASRDLEPRVVQVPLSQVDSLSSVRIYTPKELVSIEGRMRVQRAMNEVVKRFPDGVPMLDPESDMKIDQDNFRKLKRRIEGLEAMMARHPLHGSPDLEDKVKLFARRRELGLRHKIAKRSLKAAQGMIHKDDLRHMQRVLRRLNHTNEDGVVAMKGQVACEITSADALVTTELVFDGLFKELSLEMCVAVVAALTERVGTAGKDPKDIKMSEECKDAYERVRVAAQSVGKQMSECKVLDTSVNDFMNSFRPEMMELCREWAKGTKFETCMKVAPRGMYEGSVVRSIRRINEVLWQLKGAMAIIGDTGLRDKFEECQNLVKRDIVFADSLFL